MPSLNFLILILFSFEIVSASHAVMLFENIFYTKPISKHLGGSHMLFSLLRVQQLKKESLPLFCSEGKQSDTQSDNK